MGTRGLRRFSLIISKGFYLNWAYSTPGSVATRLLKSLENSLMVICERLFILRHNFKIDSFFSNGYLTVVSAEFKVKQTNVISLVVLRLSSYHVPQIPNYQANEQ